MNILVYPIELPPWAAVVVGLVGFVALGVVGRRIWARRQGGEGRRITATHAHPLAAASKHARVATHPQDMLQLLKNVKKIY